MDYYSSNAQQQQQPGAYLPSINYYVNNDEYASHVTAFSANQLDPMNTYQQQLHYQQQPQLLQQQEHHQHLLQQQQQLQMPMMEQSPGGADVGGNKRRLSDVTNDDELFNDGDLLTSNKRSKTAVNPFAPECSIPLPFQLGDEYGYFGPASIWKRNERERHRVRCVNDGYEKLRSNLPFYDKDKRLSKVETLRLAIRYIRHMQKLLVNENHNEVCTCNLDVQVACSPGDEQSGDGTKRRKNGKKQKFSSDDSDSFEDIDY